MTAAGQVRSEIVSRLKAAGLDAAEAYEDERFRERSGSVVAVGAKQAELAHAGLMNYLGEQYVRRGTARCTAYFVATADEESAVLTDFILKGVMQ